MASTGSPRILVDNYTYISGPASPILKDASGQFYRANSAGTYDVGTITNGKFIASGTTTPATWSQSKPANLVGWVLLPENAKDTQIKGNETLYDKNSFSHAHEYISQVISTLALNENVHAPQQHAVSVQRQLRERLRRVQ